MSDKPRTMKCGTHGKKPWKGTIVCSACNLPWQMLDEHGPYYAPRVCTCGAQLMPASAEDTTFKGRTACDVCWQCVVRELESERAEGAS
jgi:hypothetical protein